MENIGIIFVTDTTVATPSAQEKSVMHANVDKTIRAQNKRDEEQPGANKAINSYEKGSEATKTLNANYSNKEGDTIYNKCGTVA